MQYGNISMKLRSLIIILIFSAGLGYSQIGNIKTSQLWADFRYFYVLKDSLELVGEWGYRVDNLERSWRKFYINPQLRWDIDANWGVRAGLALHYTEEVILPDALEIRPWQGGLLYWPKTRWFMIEHYVRVEERINIFFDPNDTAFSIRLRYRIGTKIPINILPNPLHRLYIPMQFELFSSQEDNILERYPSNNRFVLGIGFRNGLKWGIDVNYIFQQSRYAEVVTSTDHILRIRLRFYGIKKNPTEATE